jgi:hypothetical protein
MMAPASKGKTHMSLLRILYNRALSEESRYWLYKLRRPQEFQHLRRQVNHHPKADFSIRGFDDREVIFVHITKSAGTSVALSLFDALPYHYTAWQYRVIFGRNDFNRYFKFTFVRNPWDRLYSAYNYLKNGGWDDDDKLWAEQNWAGITTFDQFVLEWLTPERLSSHLHLQPQHYFLLDFRGRALVDYLGYFETINQDFAAIAKRVNTEAILAHTNASPRGSYREAYSPQAQEKVANLYQRDIALFGYQFDGFNRKKVVHGRLVDHDAE